MGSVKALNIDVKLRIWLRSQQKGGVASGVGCEQMSKRVLCNVPMHHRGVARVGVGGGTLQCRIHARDCIGADKSPPSLGVAIWRRVAIFRMTLHMDDRCAHEIG